MCNLCFEVRNQSGHWGIIEKNYFFFKLKKLEIIMMVSWESHLPFIYPFLEPELCFVWEKLI